MNVNSGGKGSLQPCHCPLCRGQLRNKRTIRRHFSTVDPYPKRGPCLEHHAATCVAEREGETLTLCGQYIENAPPDNNVFASNSGVTDSADNPQDSNDDVESGSEIEGNVGESDDNSELENSNNEEDSANENSDIDTETGSFSDHEIEKLILRILEQKVKNGWSREETIGQLRGIYELLKDDRIPHKSWEIVLKFLRKLGYKSPKHYKVCCGRDHVTLLENKEDCPNCGSAWKSCMDYYVLGLQLQDYFLDEITIKDHMKHWEAKEEWLNKDNLDGTPLKEVWHGERFRELSYFWDEGMESCLPVYCPNCENIISTDEIYQSVLPGNTLDQPVSLSCNECTFDFFTTPNTMKGCPLNQAFIFHEDGFNAFVQKSRGIAAIHVSSACISKEQRTRGEYMRVFSFIPSFSLGEGISHKIDAFFKPLVEEVKDMYINGIDIRIEHQIKLHNGLTIDPGDYRVRLLLLLGTADLKGHQEITLYAGGGRLGCRRCLVNGIYIPAKRHYYYGNFGTRFRHPNEMKTAHYHLRHGRRVDSAMSVTERQTIQTETGVTGISVLFELYSLYGFDPVQDMVIDRMHVTFNMLKREFIDKIWADMGPNANRDANSREPGDGGLIVREEFGSALSVVNWPKEEKAAGVAKLKSLTDKLGSWKSNEFKKFSSIAREVLAEKIPSKAYDSYLLLTDAVQMLYSKELRKNGWSDANITRLKNLLWTHAIRAEEFYGLGFCTENLEYSVHVADEIRRHSSMDNYSCELYERAIRIHKKQKNNARGIEKTFAERESIRDFLVSYKRKNGPISTYGENEAKFEFQMTLIDDGRPFFFNESSFNSAVNLLTTLKSNPNDHVQHAIKFGVAVGKMQSKAFPDAIVSDIKRYFDRQLGLQNQAVPNILQSIKYIALFDQYDEITKIAKSDVCKISSNDNTEEWIMKINDIIQVGPLQNKYYSFINGEYFIPTFSNGQVMIHQWTGTPKYASRTYNRDSVQPITCIKRKVMMYPDPSSLDDPDFFLCNDYKSPELLKPVRVPIYPDVGDTVKVKGRHNEDWYGKVTDVKLEEKKATVQWYKETRRRGIWLTSNETDEVHFASLLGIAETKRVFGGMTISDLNY